MLMPSFLLFSPFEKAFVRAHTRNGKTVGPFFTKRIPAKVKEKHTRERFHDHSGANAKVAHKELEGKKKMHQTLLDAAQKHHDDLTQKGPPKEEEKVSHKEKLSHLKAEIKNQQTNIDNHTRKQDLIKNRYEIDSKRIVAKKSKADLEKKLKGDHTDGQKKTISGIHEAHVSGKSKLEPGRVLTGKDKDHVYLEATHKETGKTHHIAIHKDGSVKDPNVLHEGKFDHKSLDEPRVEKKVQAKVEKKEPKPESVKKEKPVEKKPKKQIKKTVVKTEKKKEPKKIVQKKTKKKSPEKKEGKHPVETVKVDYKGDKFESGKPVKFKYNKNTVSSVQSLPKGDNTFQQKIEPAGNYITHDSMPESPALPGWEKGEIEFKSPLVIELNTGDGMTYDENSWKARLSEKYNKKGKALSQAIRNDGYDAIVTVDKKYDETAEIVDLTHLSGKKKKLKKSLPPKPEITKDQILEEAIREAQNIREEKEEMKKSLSKSVANKQRRKRRKKRNKKKKN